MSKMPYVKFYSESFMTGVSGLTNEECGMYIKLLCLQHQSGHLDERTICLTCAIKSISEIPYVMKKFEQDEDGLYFNSRMEIEIQKAEKYVESRIENGKNGGRPKKKDAEKKPQENHMDINKKPYVEPYENHTDTYRALDISSSILDSSNMELRENNEDSNVAISILTKTEEELREKQKNHRKKNADSVSEKKKDEIKDFVPFVDEYEFSGDLRDAVINWLEYKNDRKEYYTDRGIRTMLKQAKRKAKEFGEDAIISAFETAIERGWMGTLIGKMTTQSIQPQNGQAVGVQKYQQKAGRFEQIDFDKIEV